MKNKSLLAMSSVLAVCIAISACSIPRLPLIHESEHFSISYTTQDEPVAEISAFLEVEAHPLSALYGVSFEKRILVDVYADLDSFHEAIGLKDAPTWVLGACLGTGRIAFVSPLNPGPSADYDDIMQVAVHEYMHLVVSGINRNCSLWLDEGLAVRESGQLPKPEQVARLLAAANVPSIEEMQADFEGVYGYDYSGLLVDYMLTRFSREAVIGLVKKPEAIEAALGIGSEVLYEDWKASLLAMAEN